MYQLFRSLAYIHSLGICHRDIKPQNLLLDPETAVLKLCDFGSAKQLLQGEPNVSYICSRYYRAPELIFGAINYTTKIGEHQHWSFSLIQELCLINFTFHRRLERWLRVSWITTWSTNFPWRLRCGSIGWDHQSIGDTDEGSD